jgi:hypothetical protein
VSVYGRRRKIVSMFLVIDSRRTRSPECEIRIWKHLWELRDIAPVSVVLPTVVSSPCPLLAEEHADAILSATGIQVPQETAWVPMNIDLLQFATSDGDVRFATLKMALDDCVDRGDALHDLRDWPSSTLRYDSWLNRRLAIAIRGWGDLVQRRGADPTEFHTLNELEDLAGFINDTLRARSRLLARRKGHCPSVELSGAGIHASAEEMKLRWQRAVDDTALRHRNLVTMSVWDIFPREQPADPRYFDLLPILRCANCLSFRRYVDITHWNINEFRRFYERVSAILQCTLDRGRIAKQV